MQLNNNKLLFGLKVPPLFHFQEAGIIFFFIERILPIKKPQFKRLSYF